MVVKNKQIHTHSDIHNERVDDIPLLLAQMKEMRVPELINQCFPTHGNWQGLSPGHVVAGWLTFIMSQSNHRLSHLRSWAATRLQTLRASLGVPLVETDFTDDRLALTLDYLSDNECWKAFEDALNGHLIRIYDLHGDLVRLDSTSASSYGQVTKDGLLQFGHSKDHRPDLPQLKINLSTLDPLGLPLTATITSGEKADDPLYTPEIDRVRQTLQKHGLLYVGDSKMGALSTRAHVVAGEDYYLCPLSAVQVSAADLAQLLEPVSQGELKPVAIWRRDEETGRREKIGAGFEYTVTLTAEHDGKESTWEERRFVVCSLSFAQAQKKSLDQRLRRAAAEIRQLNQRKQGKKELKTAAEYRAAVGKILMRHRVSGLLEVDYLVKRSEKQIRAWGHHPARVEVTETSSVRVRRDQAAIRAAKEQLGWRVYATNAPEEKLSLTKAVLIYRGAPQIERGFRRLKGPLSLTPLYLETTTRLTGLVRLLLIGLRVLGLVEYKARRSLAAKGEKIAGLTKGLPKKETARPTTEAILQAFENVTLTQVGDAWYLTRLNALQKQLLELLGFSQDIYHCLVPHFSEVPIQMSET
jgi:transposase